MFAILAAIAFGVALILHLAGGSAAQYVTDAEIAGWLCLALHLVPWSGVTVRRPGS
jgi:hypothetical protein